MRRLLVLAAVSAVAGVAAASASATHECAGLSVCVPVAGPWVLAPGPAATQWQLSCPKRFVVAGLDAQLTTPALDLAFLATLGSPVNPGKSTSRAAVFLARLVAGRDPAASFRPHVGCISAGGGGPRVPTAHHRFYPPGRPTAVRASAVPVRAGTVRRVNLGCPAGEHLVTASAAIGFFTKAAPSETLARAVQVTHRTARGRFAATIRGGSAVRRVRAVVQLDLLCAGGG